MMVKNDVTARAMTVSGKVEVYLQRFSAMDTRYRLEVSLTPRPSYHRRNDSLAPIE